MRWLDGITYSMDRSLSKLQEMAKYREAGVLQSMGSQRVGHDRVTEQHTYIHMKNRKILNIQLHVCLFVCLFYKVNTLFYQHPDEEKNNLPPNINSIDWYCLYLNFIWASPLAQW